MDAALHSVYADFCSFGAGQAGSREMDSAHFLKLARDCGLLDRRLTTTSLDLIFTRCKGKGQKTVDFAGFQQCLHHIAATKGASFDDVASAIVTAGGPTVSGTIADDVRFHDDQTTYTGVHQHGGPTHVDRHNVSMDYQLDRSSADVRGVKQYQYSPEGVTDAMGRDRQGVARSGGGGGGYGGGSGGGYGGGSGGFSAAAAAAAGMPAVVGAAAAARPSSRQAQDQTTRRQSSSSASTSKSAAAPLPRRSSAAAAAAADPSLLEERVAEVFFAFAGGVARANAAADIDGARFFKLCKDSDLIDGRSLSRTDCDLIFAKALARAGVTSKRMSIDVFRRSAVPMLAAQKGCAEGFICQQIAATPGVEMSGTVAGPNRFHDDKTTYTGVHVAGGPTHVDHRISLSNLADRSGADGRGVKLADYEGDRNYAALRRPSSRGAIGTIPASERRRSSASSSGMPSLYAGDSRRGSAVNANGNGNNSSSNSDMMVTRRPSAGAVSSSGNNVNGNGPVFAGSANRKGGVYDRLCNPSGYTGVYAERFSGGSGMGGRINGDTAAYNAGARFSGSTNSGGDYIVRDISQICNRR